MARHRTLGQKLNIFTAGCAGLLFIACDGLSTQPADADATYVDPNAELLTFAETHFPVTLTKIAEGVWVHTSNYRLPGQAPIASNGLIVEDGDGVIVVDTPWGEMATYSLIQKVQSEVGKPITKTIVTHHHPDRLAGIDILEAQGAESFAHPQTPILAAQNGFPVPDRTITGLQEPQSRVRVGPVEIAYPGPAHAQDNLVVYVNSANILFGGCAIKSAGSQNLGNIANADLSAWPDSLNWVKATYPETQQIVPGHGKGADLSLIDHTLGLVARSVNAADTPSDTP